MNFRGHCFTFCPRIWSARFLISDCPRRSIFKLWAATWRRIVIFANKLLQQVKYVPGAVDLRIQQP